MTKALRLSLALGAMLMAAPADAASLNVSLTYNLHYAGTDALSVIIPQGPDAVAPALTNVVGTVNYITAPPESVDGQYRSPWQYTKSPGGTEYESGGTYTSVQYNSSGDIVYGSDLGSLALAWGSPDSYNVIEFYDNINGLVAWLDGSEVGNQRFGINFVGISLITGVFDTVRFISNGQNAFEFSNVRTVLQGEPIPDVPVPAGLMLLLSALLGLGFLGRARAKTNY